MWTATIHKTDFNNGSFRAYVKYSDGTNSFDETVGLSTQDNLNKAIRNRIQGLEEVSTFVSTVPMGPFAPSQEVATPYELALKEVSRVKNLVSLGILKETDQEFVDAVSALKAEYAKL